jgi:hypothetical protein
MGKAWFIHWFSHSAPPDSNAALAKANLGDAEAQFGLGLKFALSNGATPDYGQAAVWYRKAAEQHHCLAQFNLGIMYAQGQGLERDDTQSTQWFFRAALHGDAGAQFHLGNHYHRASFNGSPQAMTESRIEAYKWFHLAAAQGYLGSDEACATLLFKMTQHDVAVGDQRVAVSVVDA